MRAEGVTLLEAIREFFTDREAVHVRDLYAHLPEEHEHSIRARIYENLGTHFKRIGRGLYAAKRDDAVCIVVRGDAWEEVKKLPSQMFHALVTDPPYPWLNRAMAKGTTRRNGWSFPTRDIDRPLGLELYRVLRHGAHAFFFIPAETARTRAPINEMVELLISCGFQFRKRLIWDKLKIGLGYDGRGRHEGIIFMSRGKRRLPFDRRMADVLSVPSIDSRLRRHETEKPVDLIERLVRFSTEPGDAILDCFAGSCSTGRAALALGRNSVMIECEERAIPVLTVE